MTILLRHPTTPILSHLTRAVTAGGGGFSILSLFAAGEQGGVYDASRLDTLFSDAAGTTPAVVDGVVGKQLDLSGRGNHRTQATTAMKPILRASGGLYWLEYDGIDDVLPSSSINFTTTDKMTVWCALRKASDAARGMFLELSDNSTINNGTFGLEAPNAAAAATYFMRLRGDANGTLLFSGFAAPVTNVLTLSLDIAAVAAADEMRLRANGVTQTGSSAVVAGTAAAFGNYPLYIGRRGTSALPFNGREYYTVVRGAASTAAQISSTERIAAAKCGVTL